MPIANIEQPDFIFIDDTIRLRKYDGIHDFAYEWYQDTETVRLVDGVDAPYSMDKLNRMYAYLFAHGELYFIEIKVNDTYQPIGDVTFWQEDMPIVIGDRNFRGIGIGRKAVSALIERGKALGYDALYVSEIYDYNTGSQKCFESMGFQRYEKTDKGYRYRLVL